jgi:hypothetical protein
MYGGYGFQFRINRELSTLLEIGFKGFHMSFNALDVNPHGLTAKAGLVF